MKNQGLNVVNTDIEAILKIRKYFEQTFSSKLEKLDETNPILGKYVNKTDSKEKNSQNPCYGLDICVSIPSSQIHTVY